MELYFCSQCGISIPQVEVESGAASAGEGRWVCAEHRPGARAPAATEAPAASEPVELLFCANCSVSIPVGDAQSGRARREFGSLLCAACSSGDASLRERRRKAVEAEMTAGRPAPASAAEASKRCSVCAAAVPDSQIASGRALVDGHRVVCGRCRDAGAVPAAAASSGGLGNWVLWGALIAAVGATGFFGMKYVQHRSEPQHDTVTEKQLAALRGDLDTRLTLLENAVLAQSQTNEAASKAGLDMLHDQLSDELLSLREDLAEARARLDASHGDLAQRVARLEGQLAGMQEMIKGLASRPAVETPPRQPEPPAPGPGAGPDAGAKSPEGPPPVPPVLPQPDADVTRLLKDLLESPDVGTRFVASNELITRKERSAIPAFAKVVLEDANVMVRRSAARGLGELRAWLAVPALVQALEDKEAYVAAQANFSLEAITGVDFKVTTDDSLRDRKVKAAAARKWWEQHKDSPPDGVCLEPVALPEK